MTASTFYFVNPRSSLPSRYKQARARAGEAGIGLLSPYHLRDKPIWLLNRIYTPGETLI